MKEGVIQFDLEHAVAEQPDAHMLAEFFHWRRELRVRNLIGRTLGKYQDLSYGNLSCRRPPADAPQGSRPFLITASQTSRKPEITAEDIVTVAAYDVTQNLIQANGKASSESLTHAALYDCDPRIQAVFHVHDERLWRLYRNRLPGTPLHVENGTIEMAKESMFLYRGLPNGAFVMRGHQDGLCVFGESMQEVGNKIISLFENVR